MVLCLDLGVIVELNITTKKQGVKQPPPDLMCGNKGSLINDSTKRKKAFPI